MLVQRGEAAMCSRESRSHPNGRRKGNKQDIFVGRDPELGLLTDLLDQASAGRGQFVSVSGEPGIGKTTLAAAAARIAARKGFTVLWGRCHEGQYVPPYWPWKQILRRLLELSSAPKGPARDSHAAALAPIVAESPLPKPLTAARSDPAPEQAQLQILDSATTILASVSDRKPLFLIFDNLHCAEPFHYAGWLALDFGGLRRTLVTCRSPNQRP
jgi:predicted ATPase